MATGDNAALTRASVSFNTNDDDKNDDTLLEVSVQLIDGTTVAKIEDTFGTFGDHGYAGPYDLTLDTSPTRGALKTGHVTVKITPNGQDTWRFNLFLDLLFEDGAHLMARANHLELKEGRPDQVLGIE